MSDEHTLIDRAASGSTAALERLWHAHRAWVAAVVSAHKPAEADLQDVLQDVAAALVCHIHEVRDPNTFRGWLRILARNTAVSTGRRATLQRRTFEPLAPDTPQRPDPHADRVPERLDARRKTERTLAAMSQLTPDERECLLLRAMQGLSQAAIAQKLGVPITTVESRLARARRRLRAVLQSPHALRSTG